MAREQRKRSVPVRIAAVLIALGIVLFQQDWTSVDGTAASPQSAAASPVAELFQQERSGEMVTVSGTVERTLPDDREGSRHQRFILRLPDGLTVLVAHNIDLAPRVPLDEGDAVEARGQYEHNDQGGVLHWTHHDPQKRHAEGWIRHAGQLYE